MRFIKGIDHVSVVTADLDRFIAFYSTVMGLEPVSMPALCHPILRCGEDA